MGHVMLGKQRLFPPSFPQCDSHDTPLTRDAYSNDDKHSEMYQGSVSLKFPRLSVSIIGIPTPEVETWRFILSARTMDNNRSHYAGA